LPDRNAATAAAWMRNFPDLMAISRDRGGEYAAAAVVGAPQALQYADRFHLINNLGGTGEAVLTRHLFAHHTHPTESYSPTFLADPRFNQPPKLNPKEAALSQAKREERLARYNQVVTLHQQGLSHQAIAARVGMGRTTVSRWLKSSAFPERAAASEKDAT